MEESEIERLRRRLAKAGGRGRRGYGAELRSDVVALARRWLAQGGSQRALAAKLGLSTVSMARWETEVARETPRLRPVEVEEDREPKSEELVAILPCGVRIEGITLEDVAELARRLG